MSLPVALQLYTVRDSAAADFYGTLKAVKAMGYDGVEFAGLFDNEPAKIKEMLDEIGLVPVSAHVPLDQLISETEKTINDYKIIGCKYIAIPYVTEERRPGAEKFDETIEEIKRIGKAASEAGIKLLYHNHDFEFVKLENGKYGLDELYSRVCPCILATEIDTCWVNVAGLVPSEYVMKYSGRAPVVHLKDFNITGKLPKHLYALIGLDEEETDEGNSSFEFRPVGHGMQNIPDILKASVDAGAEWVVVEQDEPAAGNTRDESAKLSRDYLKSLGW